MNKNKLLVEFCGFKPESNARPINPVAVSAIMKNWVELANALENGFALKYGQYFDWYMTIDAGCKLDQDDIPTHGTASVSLEEWPLPCKSSTNKDVTFHILPDRYHMKTVSGDLNLEQVVEQVVLELNKKHRNS
jgi:hypothetical protein